MFSLLIIPPFDITFIMLGFCKYKIKYIGVDTDP